MDCIYVEQIVKCIHETHFGLGEGKTTSGPDSGKPCHFPFEYHGLKYHTCTEEDSSGHPWCATAAQFSNTTYGFCNCTPGRCHIDYKLNLHY